MMSEKSIGQSTLSEMLPYLRSIANQYGLNLSRLNDFKMAKFLLITLYCQ